MAQIDQYRHADRTFFVEHSACGVVLVTVAARHDTALRGVGSPCTPCSQKPDERSG